MTAKFATAHPGKMGDALYSLPFIRHIYNTTGEKIDFYTSDYCAPMRRLFEYQSCINEFVVSPHYRVERMDMGCQPADILIDKPYEQVYQLGFHRIPDRAIHQFIAAEQGVTIPLAVEYEFPKLTGPLVDSTYICIAPRSPSSFQSLFDALADRVTCVVIGGPGDYSGHGLDYTGKDFLETLSIMSGAKGFVGLMSSQLVLANGFPYSKIAPWDGRSWDMSHVIYQASNHYPVNPSVDHILSLLGDING